MPLVSTLNARLSAFGLVLPRFCLCHVSLQPMTVHLPFWETTWHGEVRRRRRTVAGLLVVAMMWWQLYYHQQTPSILRSASHDRQVRTAVWWLASSVYSKRSHHTTHSSKSLTIAQRLQLRTEGGCLLSGRMSGTRILFLQSSLFALG
jgi:hypothetical protein